MRHTKIAIIGAGAVGSTTAYALMLKNIAAEILLVDVNELRCKGEMLDLSDTLPLCLTSSVHQATLADARGADIIIISAGIPQKPGQSRTELLSTNKKIIVSILTQLQPLNSNSLIIVATNPVDIITRVAQEHSGLPTAQVFGSGTLLDSLRLRGLIARSINVAQESVQAYILGEHGDSQFAAWSLANIAGIPLTNFPQINNDVLQKIEQETQQKAYDIISCKGSTFYGIAACLATICESIVFNQQRVIPVSSYQPDFNVYLSVPVVVGETGITHTIPLGLSEYEQKQLLKSALALKAHYNSVP